MLAEGVSYEEVLVNPGLTQADLRDVPRAISGRINRITERETPVGHTVEVDSASTTNQEEPGGSYQTTRYNIVVDGDLEQ